MISEVAVWAIFLLPVGALVVNAFVVRPLLNHRPGLAALVIVAALGAALLLSVWTLISVVENGTHVFDEYTWLAVGGMELRIGLMVDSLTAIMLVVVTGVSLMVQVYSHGYMKGDPGYVRYFAFMSLFSAAMIGLVLAGNIIQLYVMWELVGLGSYLLIGFWHNRPAAAAAAKKAFLVTRIGDFGFLLAILYLFFNRAAFMEQGLDPLSIADIQAAVPLIKTGAIAALGGLGLTWVALGIFAGAAGKSAQFPLHVWLPDAMEGPTPVSALIHAATMVAAGVFLVARFFPVFEASNEAMAVVALVGAFTALFAASMGLVMKDIKRVLAYSTISQLGYMMAALGIGAYGAAIFHLFTHAFFKALLFLGSGSVNHATGTFDMRYMGGLRKIMPWTYALMMVGSLSLVGIFPLAGFWSKDEIIGHAWHGDSVIEMVVFWMLAVSVAATAFYTFRMMYMTFHGKFRGGVEAEQKEQQTDTQDSHGAKVHLAESPPVMVAPMVILGVGAVVGGYLVNPQAGLLGIPVHWFSEFVVPPVVEHTKVLPLNSMLAAVTTIGALVFIGLATAVYVKGKRVSPGVERAMKPVHRTLEGKYYFDELYEDKLVVKGFYGKLGGFLEWFDQQVVDSVVDAMGWFSRNLGWAFGRLQSGQAQFYGVGILTGIVVILVAYLVWG